VAYRQYTQCVSPSDFVTQAVYLLPYGGLAAAVAALGLLFGFFVPGLMIAALTAVIGYCNWWLKDRLVCLGGDVCAVGFVLEVDTPDQKSGFDRFDTDYCVSIVLPPTLVGATQDQVQNSVPLGNLVKEQPGAADLISQHSSLSFTGLLITKFSDGDPYGGQFTTSCLHNEFEGGGIYDLLQACEAALAFSVAAAAVCGIPIIGWIVCTILSIISGAITLVGIINALNDEGNPNDVNSNLGTIHPAQSPDGYGADILMIRGTWVYDSAHAGWNEIHPVKACQKIGSMLNQQWSEIQVGLNPNNVLAISDVSAFVATWCSLSATINLPGTVANQQLPQNQWILHPLVDGCQPTGGNPPPLQ
jgi:hypothetical protein